MPESSPAGFSSRLRAVWFSRRLLPFSRHQKFCSQYPLYLVALYLFERGGIEIPIVLDGCQNRQADLIFYIVFVSQGAIEILDSKGCRYGGACRGNECEDRQNHKTSTGLA